MLEDVQQDKAETSCAVRKDAGDDPDITDGILVYARAERFHRNGIIIEGGEGVGRVTKTWLDAPVGEAAITARPPRWMIQEQAAAVCAQYGYVSLYQEETSWLNAPLTLGLALWEGFLSLVRAA